MRVTGDCLPLARLPVRFVAAFFRVAPDRAVTLVALLRFAPLAVFAALFLAGARFDTADVFRRAFLPDDFDAVAMMVPRGRYERIMRKIRAQR